MAPPPALLPRRPSPRPLINHSLHRQLLTKRFLSLEKFHQEMHQRWSKNPPPTTSKAIPVPLYPKETFQQYTPKFKQWLAAKDEDLASMRHDPNRERSFWHSFAHHRVGTLSTMGKTATELTTRGRKRSFSEEDEESYYQPTSVERKRTRREKSTERGRSFRSRSPMSENDFYNFKPPSYRTERYDDSETLLMPRSQSGVRSGRVYDELKTSYHDRRPRHRMTATHHRSTSPSPHTLREDAPKLRSRTEILSRRTISVSDYLRELDEQKRNPTPRRPEERLTKIPVPLFPSETMHDYDADFRSWRAQHDTSLTVLRSQPYKERVHRHQYARQKVLRKTQTAARRDSAPQLTTSHSIPATDRRDKLPSQTLAREPASAVLSTDLFQSKAVTRPPSLHSFPRERSLRKSDAGSYTSSPSSRTFFRVAGSSGEFDLDDDHSDTATDTQTQTSNCDVNMNTDSSNCSAVSLLSDLANGKQCNADDRRASKSSNPQFPNEPSNAIAPVDESTDVKTFPRWALQLVNQMQMLEKKVAKLQQELDKCHVTADNRVPLCCCGEQVCSKHTLFPRLPAHSSPKQTTSSKVGTTFAEEFKGKKSHSSDHFSLVAPSHTDKDVEGGTDTSAPATRKSQLVAPANSDIRQTATMKLARAVQSRIAEDPEKRRLTEAYDHLNELIIMNETAIDDALSYVKAMKEVDEIGAKEHHSQIKELVASINQEKERRTNALVKLLVYNWAQRPEELKRLLDNVPSAGVRSRAKHEECAAIASQIEEKDSELETLEMQLNDQFQVVGALSPSASEPDRALQFEVLQKLSESLSKEQAAKKLLEGERENALTCFLECDNEIRKLVTNSL